MEIGRLEDPAVGGNFIAGLKNDCVTDYHVLQWNRMELTAAEYLDLLRFPLGVKDFKLPVALELAGKAHAGGEDDRCDDGQAVQWHVAGCCPASAQKQGRQEEQPWQPVRALQGVRCNKDYYRSCHCDKAGSIRSAVARGGD